MRKTETHNDCHLSERNDNNAIMAQLLMLGTNETNVVGFLPSPRSHLAALFDNLTGRAFFFRRGVQLAWMMVDYSRSDAFNDDMTVEQITVALSVILREGLLENGEAYRAPLDALYDSLGGQSCFHVPALVRRWIGFRQGV